MNLREWEPMRRTAWENDYVFLRIDRLAKTGEFDTFLEIERKIPI